MMFDDDEETVLSQASTRSSDNTTDVTAPTVHEHDEGDDHEDEDGDEDDENDDDHESGHWELASGQATSVPPAVFEDELAYGRRYHGFRKGLYPIPNDEVERHKEETLHAMFLQLMSNHLLYSPLGDMTEKIMDIGTGTGIWAIDVADLYPNADIIGTDLSPIQPSWVPINVRMFIEDCEEPEWLHGSGYDLVHFRQMAGVLRDLDGLLRKVYPHVKDGGWVEFHEILPEVCCDDGTMPADDPLVRFNEKTREAMGLFGFKHLQIGDIEKTLEQAGFTNIHCITKKVPISAWPSDNYLRTLGVLMETIVKVSLEAMAAKPLAALLMPEEERRHMAEMAMQCLEDKSVHRYYNCCFCYAQKREGEHAAFYGNNTTDS